MDGFDSYDRPGESQSEPVLKIVILGEPGVGKSSLIQRFLEDRFSCDSIQTSGVEFHRKRLTFPGTLMWRRPNPQFLRAEIAGLRTDIDSFELLEYAYLTFRSTFERSGNLLHRLCCRSCGRQSAHLGHWWIGHAGKPNAEKLPS
ncbi:hypothetical protein RvY_08439-3 [Ramazzottius varieornatus]|uniref:Uncharacterized protein n=1 Tax=Ramazzottius varieornatus TaxID=947166 RepID=A0A1D1V5X9_RAMVA|nr:hypothetical protein RvY_08439-3 [Ramazzottius varieornatus]